VDALRIGYYNPAAKGWQASADAYGRWRLFGLIDAARSGNAPYIGMLMLSAEPDGAWARLFKISIFDLSRTLQMPTCRRASERARIPSVAKESEQMRRARRASQGQASGAAKAKIDMLAIWIPAFAGMTGLNYG